jgi:OmpA-OmpF porin, OOP family
MKYLYYLLLIPLLSSCMFGGSPSSTSGQYPNQRGGPYDRRNDKGATIDRVELTDQYTVLYMSFTNTLPVRYTPDGRYDPRSYTQMAIKTSSRLYALGGARVFRFVKADNIVYDPDRQSVAPRETKRFVLYYERLDPGIEKFDLFECNDTDTETCWDFYDVEVYNPAPQLPKRQPKQDPAPIPTPAPVPAPAPTKTPKTPPSTPKSEPAPVVTPTIVAGTITDAKTKKPVSATVTFAYELNKKPIDSVQSFSQNGAYRLKMLPNYIYYLTVSAKGYLVATAIIDLSKSNTDVKQDFALTPLAVGDKVTLQNIYFEMSKADILEASFAELDKLAQLMTDNPTMRIRLEGHTDIIGDKDLNMQLSKDRVWNVRKYLAAKKIDINRIDAVGYGDTRPIVTKGTEEQRKVNRRVEFVILNL